MPDRYSPRRCSRHRAVSALGALLLALACLPAEAQGRGGKLLLTGGVSSIDGAAGGGLTPWAVTGSYATDGQWGATAHASWLRTGNYRLQTYGVTLGLGERLEMSLARQDLDTQNNLAALGLPGLHLKQDIVGLKLRVAGDAVLDADSWMPQIAVGLQHKRSNAGALGATLHGPLGAAKKGTDVYLSATKLLLAQGLLLNGTLRATKANQNGLLGFGGAQADKLQLMPEVSLVVLLSRQLAIGAEYRAQPDNLNRSLLGAGALKEDDWTDVFVAWAPNKQFSLTLAYVDLGRVAPALKPKRQRGAYLSTQLSF